jgi:TonB family protein
MSSTGIMEPGTLVADRYRIDESLGGEASGALYRATDLRLERAVGLRALAPADGAQQGKAAARLVHPNVARVLDFGLDAALGVEFVVADLGTGGSLAALLAQRGTPPLPLASRIVQEAAAGMAAAHRAGLVHGDLHPGVLWLSRDEGRLRVQVLGLGLNPGGAPPSRVTARYASPERLRRGKVLPPAADVFSLGVIAYEVFAGLPAEWTSLLLSMARGQAVMAPSLRDARPELPAHVAQAVRRALLADPGQRWPDAGELAAHLIAESAAAPAPAPVAAVTPAAPVTTASFAATVSEAAAQSRAVEAAAEPEAVEAAPPSEAVDVAASTEVVEAEAQPEIVEAAALVIEASPVGAEMEPAVADEPAPEPIVAVVAEEPIAAVAEPVAVAVVTDEPELIVASVVDEAMAAPVAEAAAEPVSMPEPVAAPAPRRQPPARRAPLAAAKTDLADSLYIPPVLQKAAPAAEAPRPATPVEAPLSAPVVSAPAPVAPTPMPEPVLAKAEPVIAAPARPVQEMDDAIEAPLVPIARPMAVMPVGESVALAPLDATETAVVQIGERRRRPGLARLGQPTGGHRRGLLAAGIAAAVLVGGGVIAKTVLAGADVTAPTAQGLAAAAMMPGAGAGGTVQPEQPAVADPAAVQPLPPVDSAARAALTPEEQRRQDEERKKLEEQRRLQLRQRDSLRAVQQQQLAAQAQAQQVAPQEVALATARPAASAPAPQIEQRAAATVPTAPAETAASAPAPARPRVDASRVYGGGEVDQAPSLTNGSSFRSAVNRTYPATLRSSGVWGNALVSFTVGTDGRVERSSISVEQASHPAFRAAAQAAISSARFNPARVDGQPVRATVSMPITWQGSGARNEDDDRE